MRKRRSGFSLVELMIVVAIILIITGIAVPNLLRSKMEANEASAAEALETLNTACFAYLTTYQTYPSALADLGETGTGSNQADLIDSVLASGTKSGYKFNYQGTPDANGNVSFYAITANPSVPGTTGLRGFFTDQTGVIRANPDGPANAASPPIS